MIKRLLAVSLTIAALITLASPAHALSWAQNYGVGSYDINGKPSSDPFYGSGTDIPRAIAPMPDGGFVVAGQIAFPFLTLHSTYSGASDAVLVRCANDGTVLWQEELRQTNDAVSNGTYAR